MTDDDTTMPPRPALVVAPPDQDEADGLELEERQIQEMRSIFATSLPQYLDPLDEMCRQLLGGDARAEVVAALQAAIGSLRQAAEKMSFHDVAVILEQLEDAVTPGLDPDADAVPRERREQILGLLLDLRQIAEDSGGAQEKLRGTPLAERLHGLPGAAEVATRLARAGVVLDVQLQGARPDELAAVSGLDREVVEEVLAWLSGGGRAPVLIPAAPPGPAAPAPPAAIAAPTPAGFPVAASAPPDRPRLELGEHGVAETAAAVEALLAALERLAGRLDETRQDIQARRATARNLQAQRAELEQERERARLAHAELERWLVASGEVRTRLRAQRELYAAALHAAQQQLAQRHAQLVALERDHHEQTTELAASREALRQLETMMNRLRSRLGRARMAR